jgi:predicted O-methyltransferase YrrM
MIYSVLAIQIATLALIAIVAYKLRERFRFQDERLTAFRRKLGTEIEQRLLPVLQGISAEAQNSVSLTALGLRFPVFLGDSSIDSFHARRLIQELVARQPSTIVELGSGSSTVLIARVIQLMGLDTCKHISVDHETIFLELSKRYAELNGLASRISFHHCPLGAISSVGKVWYSGVPEALEGRKIDLLVIDGPPAYQPGQQEARYPALPVLYPHLSPHCTIILDDANRPGELEIVKRWLAEYPDFKLVRHKQGKGLAVLVRN